TCGLRTPAPRWAGSARSRNDSPRGIGARGTSKGHPTCGCAAGMVALEMMSRHLGQSIVRRIYAVGLALGSRDLRTHYGDEMRETFGDRAAAASGRGFAALAMLVCRELADLVRC